MAISPWKTGDWAIDSVLQTGGIIHHTRIIRYSDSGIGLMRYIPVNLNFPNEQLIEQKYITLNETFFKNSRIEINNETLREIRFNNELENKVRVEVQQILGVSNEKMSSFENELDELSKVNLNDVIIHVLNVGQGDSIFVQCGDEFGFLIDAHFRNGNFDKFDKFIKSIGFENKIRFLLISHPHFDHISAARKIVKHFDVPYILLKDGAITTTSTFRDLIRNESHRIIKISKEINFKNFRIIPSAASAVDGLNENGLIVLVEYNKNFAVLAGDMSGKYILQSLCGLRCKTLSSKNIFYKVSHHCSQTAEPNTLSKCIKFSAAATSVGSNGYGHPHVATQSQISKLTSGKHRLTLLQRQNIGFSLKKFKFI